MLGGVRRQRQLVQRPVKLRHRFCHRRARGWTYDRPCPSRRQIFDEPGFGVMLGEELELAVDQLGGMGFERFGDLRVQLLARAAQQGALRRLLHQRVLEGVDRVWRRAALEHQLGSDQPSETGLQLVLAKAEDGVR